MGKVFSYYRTMYSKNGQSPEASIALVKDA